MQSEVEESTPKSETARSFQAKAESALVDVETDLGAKAWAEARKSFADAQLIWDRWRKQRSTWVDLREYIQQALAAHIGKEIAADSAYGKDLKFEVDRLIATWQTVKRAGIFSLASAFEREGTTVLSCQK